MMKKEHRYVSHCWVVSFGTNSSIVVFPTKGISEGLFPFDDSGVSNFTGISSFSRKFHVQILGFVQLREGSPRWAARTSKC